jgi:hypothetical protein
MQIALNGDQEYRGGRLVFITDKGFVVPRRPVGSATIHTNEIVHGVSTLLSGVRYGLFFCDTKGAQSLLRHISLHRSMEYLVGGALLQVQFYDKAVKLLKQTTVVELQAQQQQYVKDLRKTRVTISDSKKHPAFAAGDMLHHIHMLHPQLYAKACGVTADRAVVFMEQVLAIFDSACNKKDLFARACDEYVDFLTSLKNPVADRSVPSILVDHMWHTHMGFPEQYATDCLRICGFEVDHVVS